MGNAAKQANVWSEWGGRNSMAQHLSDEQQLLQYKTLLNRQDWLLFTSPQQAYAWRQQELQQRRQMNYAQWADYTSPDQYLAFVQRQISTTKLMNDQIFSQAAAYRANADAAGRYASALSVIHGPEGGLEGLQAMQSALAGIPAELTTTLNVDDAAALAALATYQSVLSNIPQVVTTTLVSARAGSGGEPAPGSGATGTPEVIPVSYGGPYREQFAAIVAEVAELSKLRAEIPVHFELPSAAEVAAFVSQIPTAGITEPVHLVPQGGAVGVGPGPPPETIAAWDALSGAETRAAADAKLAAAAEAAAGDEAAKSGIEATAAAASWARLGAAEKSAAAGAAGGGGKPPVAPPAAAAGAEEPPDDAAAKWAALSAAEKAAATEADMAAVKFAALRAAADGDAATAGKLAAVYRTLGGNTEGLGAKTAAATGVFKSFASTLISISGPLGLLGTRIALFGGLLGTVGIVHLFIDALIELIAIVTLAAVGIIAAAAALGIFIGVAALAQDTLGRVADRLKATQVAAQATGQAIYPLGQNFDALASKIRPQVWQLYGDALNLVGGRMGLLGQIALKTGNYIDTLAAKFIVFVSSPGFQQGMTTLVKAGMVVLGQLGDIFHHLGIALVEFAKVAASTHIAEDLLSIVDAGAKLLDLILKLPTPILAVAVGLHGLYLWGGLLATGLLSLISPLRAVAVGLGGLGDATALAGLDKSASALSRLKAAIADVGAGFAAIPGRITGAGNAAKAAGADMALAGDEAALMSGEEVAATAATTGLAAAFRGLGAAMMTLLANPLTWLVVAAAAIGVISYKIFTANDNTQKWITGMDEALAKSSDYQVIGKTVADLASVTQHLAAAQHGGAGNASELAAAQSDLSGKLQQELTHVGQVSKAYGTDMVGALGLLSLAGVKADALFTKNNGTWAAAQVQVAGLVKGYAAMGQGLTQLQGDVSVQLVMNADQLAQMGKLNTAWDSWLKLVQSGPDAFVAFEQGVQTVTTNMKAAGASFSGTNAASLTLRASWGSLVPTAGQVLDAVRNYSAVLQNGAAGTALLNRATKDVIASSGQMTSKNQDVRNSLIAVAEQANPSINTWQKLTQWIGPLGAAKATADLDKVMTLLQTPVTNLQKDAALLTTTLQQDLNPAMAAATFNALGGQKAFNTYADDLKKFGGNSQTTARDGGKVVDMLLAIDKNSQTAHDQFIAWAMSMGQSRDAAEKLWKSANKLSTGSYKLQIQDNISTEQKSIDSLERQLKQTTDPAKRRLIELQIKVDESKLQAMKGDLDKAQGSAGH